MVTGLQSQSAYGRGFVTVVRVSLLFYFTSVAVISIFFTFIHPVHSIFFFYAEAKMSDKILTSD